MRANQTLKQSIIDAFIKVGCAPNPIDNTYKQYSETEQYATRGLAVIPNKSSNTNNNMIEILVDTLEENEDPDDIIIDAEN